ncbi:TetR family transcriptional regulator [Aestuariivirga litoralis]|uniref:TetR family transcriptional regulator n=1 Tax=Aestuariivirga litoralis TaxID=2650924 RepID=A0A2W2BNY0_9HYPH|nr:TetR family transcriptional regulator [Aestuariivirga litoralis]
MSNSVSAPPLRTPRTLSREERRTQLFEATLATIAECGFSRTTLTEVARRAGLSHGLVLFHFDTKERLLVETLDYLSDEYKANWQAALDASGPAPEEKLAALVEADFAPQVCQPSRVNAWSAYWGESQSRPLYLSKCGENDALYIRMLEDVCAGMNASHGYATDPARAARLIRITIEGTWLEMMTLLNPYDQQEAKCTVWTCASLLYPRHFGPDGPLAAAR